MVNAPFSQPKPAAFPVPEPAVARHPGLIAAPRELRDWAEDLPMGNPPRAAQMLLQQLRLLVRDPNPGGKLGALLDLYEQPAQRLLDVVDERLQGNADDALPLDQLDQVVVELLTELASGQLRLANELRGTRKGVPTELLYRAMAWLARARGIQWLRYARGGDDVWRLMLAIFLDTGERGVATQRIEWPGRRDDEPPEIAGLFLRSLVIGLCDPHHHRPGDVRAWQQWAGRHAQLLELQLLPRGPHSIPVDTSGELPPLTGARRGRPGPEMRYLIADRFLDQLAADPMAPGSLHDALTGLISGRRASEQRGSPRQARNHPYHLSQGLGAVFERLDALIAGIGSPEPPQAALPATQINQSKSGAAFQLQGPVNPPLTIGGVLLAEAPTNRPGAAPVGFVGRIQRVVGGGDQPVIEIGVEKLPGRVIPVTLTGGASDRARGEAQALLQHLPEQDCHHLLAARHLYREGETLQADSRNARYTLRMGRQITLTQRLVYLEVELLD